tara:strand:+ start:1088 stop:1621 length:534 start_codon:yes stop_codon:yes gene_type:complete
MKYKIIPNDIVKNMIEFLDEIQFDAAKENTPDALHKINFCNWMIGELMNSLDGFDSEDEAEEEDLKDRWGTIDSYRKDLRKDFPEDMSEEEWKKLIKQFDSFIEGWDKAYKKSNHKKSGEQNSLESFARDLKIDPDLTPEEKFELYYSEHRKRKKDKKGKSLNSILKDLGIQSSNKK